MDVRRVGRLAGDLDRFPGLFHDCIARSDAREHLRRYVGSQLSGLKRKRVEPTADALGMAPRTLQDFLMIHTWDHERPWIACSSWSRNPTIVMMRSD